MLPVDIWGFIFILRRPTIGSMPEVNNNSLNSCIWGRLDFDNERNLDDPMTSDK